MASGRIEARNGPGGPLGGAPRRTGAQRRGRTGAEPGTEAAASPSAAAAPVRPGSALGPAVRAGAVAYRREAMLPRLVALPPAELADDGIPAARRIVDRLGRALRAERRRGKAGHWTYDLNRHIGLMQALVAERRRLARLVAAAEAPPRTRTGGREAARREP